MSDERPGGWVDGIGWVARLADLSARDIAANPDGRTAQARIHRSAGVTPDWGLVIVVAWVDGTIPGPPSSTEGAEEVLRDLYRRITSKVPELERMRAEHAPPESTRLNGKADGMRVAASYVKESLDALVAAVEGVEG